MRPNTAADHAEDMRRIAEQYRRVIERVMAEHRCSEAEARRIMRAAGGWQTFRRESN